MIARRREEKETRDVETPSGASARADVRRSTVPKTYPSIERLPSSDFPRVASFLS